MVNEILDLKPDHLERLCLLLNCTPNDLFDWRAGCKTVVHDAQLCRTLIKQKNDIQTTLRELPLDKLEKLGEMLAELKNDDEQR
jgi:succinate dehydrogenase flavin-adding protein (antitoxin of CptAB toxin-antitoxin module)